MAKYDEKFKQAVVKEYLAGSSGYKALQARHGVGRTTIKSWVDVYRQHGDAGLRKKFSHYSARLKLSVLKQMWRQELSCCQAATLFDLRGGGGRGSSRPGNAATMRAVWMRWSLSPEDALKR